MKKLFAGLGAAALLLAGCGADVSVLTVNKTATVETDGGEVTATLTETDGKLTGVSIDEVSDDESKKILAMTTE